MSASSEHVTNHKFRSNIQGQSGNSIVKLTFLQGFVYAHMVEHAHWLLFSKTCHLINFGGGGRRGKHNFLLLNLLTALSHLLWACHASTRQG